MTQIISLFDEDGMDGVIIGIGNRQESGLPTDIHHQHRQKEKGNHLYKLTKTVKSEQLILSKTYLTR
jgi:hypothetical protein